ncbi:YbjN domain-containing protein [Arcanobacterium hippocoleae]|uniref:YbjN domain-containing protein n=1 Tax=Arcanobacterium hippocoleae TaxID=149017 RepID=A0ABU1T4I5_9ACTO|nr:YbjN domain-containing protein [Arcanobacterium hippocoleae]MDR6939781.1 hypothetical protein [Arcanobacterium hippocoleae]
MGAGYQAVAPLSQERVVEILKRMDLIYFIDSAGDLGMFINECVVWFSFHGADDGILLLQADPFRDIPIAELAQFRRFINHWNAKTFWPRVYPSINDDGIVRARCDYALDCVEGVTDAQIEANLFVFFSTLRDFYQQLDAKRKNNWQ